MEKVIINGVDVSGCEFFRPCKEINFYCCDCSNIPDKEDSLTNSYNCKENPKCYYKNLLRTLSFTESAMREVAKRNDHIKKYINTVNKYETALKEIRELNKMCAGCNGTACGVCTNADGKPNNSYRIADEVLK